MYFILIFREIRHEDQSRCARCGGGRLLGGGSGHSGLRATQGETMDELLRNLHEAIEGCLSVNIAEPKANGTQRVLEIAV